MSVAEYLARQEEVFANVPECWAIIANSVHARAEEYTVLAAFDTRELAEAYVRASALPADWSSEQRLVGARYRSFRPDSLLWDYNESLFLPNDKQRDSEFSIVRRIRNLMFAEIGTLLPNPPPPSGEIPMDVFAADAERRLEPK